MSTTLHREPTPLQPERPSIEERQRADGIIPPYDTAGSSPLSEQKDDADEKTRDTALDTGSGPGSGSRSGGADGSGSLSPACTHLDGERLVGEHGKRWTEEEERTVRRKLERVIVPL